MVASIGYFCAHQQVLTFQHMLDVSMHTTQIKCHPSAYIKGKSSNASVFKHNCPAVLPKLRIPLCRYLFLNLITLSAVLFDY